MWPLLVAEDILAVNFLLNPFFQLKHKRKMHTQRNFPYLQFKIAYKILHVFCIYIHLCN